MMLTTMPPALRVRLGIPEHDWLELRIETPGVDVAIRCSSVPNDPLRELVAGLRALLEGREAAIRFNAEPDEYELVLDSASIRLFHHPRSRSRTEPGETLLALELRTRDIAVAFWRALRDAESRWPTTGWRHAFPSGDLKTLGDELRTS